MRFARGAVGHQCALKVPERNRQLELCVECKLGGLYSRKAAKAETVDVERLKLVLDAISFGSVTAPSRAATSACG